METPAAVTTIDEYIAGFPDEVRPKLEEVRTAIRGAVPGVEETISYKIPTFKLHGEYVIYFAGFAKHIGVYPVPVEVPEWRADLAPYRSGKGTARFKLDRPLPLDLIARLAQYGAEKARARSEGKPQR